MSAQVIQRVTLACKTPGGKLLATLQIVAPRKMAQVQGESAPLLLLPEDLASGYGEQSVQLRERGRYEYQLKPAPGAPDNLVLRADQWVQPSGVESAGEDRGVIEPQDYCGLLPLVVVQRDDANATPLACAYVEVRSLKLGYREHYRGMLTFIADKCAALLLDSRAPTRLKLDTQWQTDARFLEQQLEFLRYTLESSAFRAAIDEVLRNPHQRLESDVEQRDISKPMKLGKDFARQLGMATRRVALPLGHPLQAHVASLPAQVTVPLRTDFFDTPENRFAKMVVQEFRDFLHAMVQQLSQQLSQPGNSAQPRLLIEARRLRGMLEGQLARGFFPDVATPDWLPLGSPVLQRKTGYRELLRFWLQFHAGAQLAWEGGADVFLAGARNVATLYEYWLFFQLEALFRQRFECDQPLHALVLNKQKIPPQLVLKRGIELASPVAGVWAKSTGRKLCAEFHFNKKFKARSVREVSGSWTRGVQPDYTLSLWPAAYSKAEAEANELMVHLHFDAKYRVERLSELMGDQNDDDAFLADGKNPGAGAGAGAGASAGAGAAKYADLLKMHAYRDAVRRTAGAYVLYPGDSEQDNRFQAFHEVLPGLGAFAIRPDQEGRALGLGVLARFLDDVIEHLANRTTSREQVSFHVSKAYEARQDRVPYGNFALDEKDQYSGTLRAPPPAEEMVLVAWYKTPAQLRLAQDAEGLVYVRLGNNRDGALHISPILGQVRKVLLRTENFIAPGLLVLRHEGPSVITREQLRAMLAEHPQGQGVADWQAGPTPDDGNIYALFKTGIGNSYQERSQIEWDGALLNQQIHAFESQSGGLAGKVNSKVDSKVTSKLQPLPDTWPRVIPLRNILQSIKR